MRLQLLPLLLLSLSSTVHANLIDRGNGLIYDQDQNITWLANANLGAGSSYDNGTNTTDGHMTWQNAYDWANNLTYAGYSDWRLPTTPDASSSIGYKPNSELGHLFYAEFGGTAGSSIITTHTNAANFNLFNNIQSWRYWSSTSATNNGWYFETTIGYQDSIAKGNLYAAWAVRDGDVTPVPLPGAVWLFGSGLLGLVGWKRCGNIG